MENDPEGNVNNQQFHHMVPMIIPAGQVSQLSNDLKIVSFSES